MALNYKNAGVDIEAGYKSVELMKQYVKETMRPEVMGGIGGFSGAFSLAKIKDMENPVLLSGTDGVGTKLKLAFLMDKNDTVGIDCVAMCVNDVACAGGEPLFFLDYIACGKNYPEKIAAIVKGVAEGCKQSDAALVGGETAEMPGFYPEDEFDLAGFAVGVVDAKDMIDGHSIQSGDILIGVASSGVHSNGFSLVRKVFDMTKESLATYYNELGMTLGEALLAPTKIYVKMMKSVKNAGIRVKGCSHITGGGFYENIPRMLPDGVRAIVRKDSYEVPALFRLMQKQGDLFGIHDQYRDYYFAAESFDEDYACRLTDGTIPTHKRWAGGQQSYLCATQAPHYVKRNFREIEKNQIHLDGAYLDVFTCNEGDECNNPRHRMTRRDCYDFRARCFDYLMSKGILPSSEEVSDWSARSLVFCHYAPYDFMLRKPGSPKYGVPVPLFNLVYHDCLIEPWMMEKIDDTEDYMLYALLNGGAPYLIRDGAYPDFDGSFEGNVKMHIMEDIKRCKVVTELHKKVAKCEMVSHEMVDGNPEIQRTMFSDGTKVTVDFGKQIYSIEM